MANFIPTKKTNPCPACDDRKGKCRTFSDSPVILCMNSTGGLERMGWINTGDTKDGLWGKLIPDDEQTRGKSWQEQQEENARRIERDRAREREKLKYALPEDERSSEFRKLLRQLELHEEDKQDLIQRGLTLDEIKELRIKSVQPNQTVEEVKPNLPGISNDTISVADSGYLCPAYDEFGKIVGCQIRLRNAEDNKYRWLKGQFSSHLLVEGDKELPLTVLKGNSQGVYLCEGILKPAIANQRHDKTFIGASGGNFSSSPNQLKRILKNVAKNQPIYFTPDAGFYLNPQVQRRDRATVELIQSLGYEVYILDWGQLEDKTAGDVDEISSEVLEQATAILASEFLKSPEQKKLEAEAGGKEVPREQWLTQKADDWWSWLKGKAISFQDILDFSRGKTQKVVDRCVKKIKYGVDPLPTPECGVKLPKIEFKQGDRLKLFQELLALGWKDIADTSITGTGKSHSYNLFAQEEDEEGRTQGKIWYLHGDHRNPTVKPAEDKPDLPSRHNGLIEDHSRETPNGKPFQRRWNSTDPDHPIEPDTPSNCPETDRFNSLATKGYSVHDKHAQETTEDSGAQNPICAQCPILHNCIEIGYKAQRRLVMERSALRAHPNSLPSPEDYSYSDDFLFWEEVSTLFKAAETRSLHKRDIDEQWEWLEREHPQGYERLRPIKHKLNDILSGKVDLPRFGANTLPDSEDEANLRNLLGIEDYPELETDLFILKTISDRAKAMKGVEFKQADHISVSNFDSKEEKQRWGEAQKMANSYLKREALHENRNANAALPTLGLYELILILFEDSEATTTHRTQVEDIFGCATVNHGELTLTLNNSRHRAIAHQAKANVYLDATIRPEDLAATLGIQETELVTISQEAPSFSNLTIHGINIEGMVSKDHSDDCNRRKKALVDEIMSGGEQGDYATISFKNDEIDHDGYWFNDSRATNKFKGIPNLIALGTPYQHYGVVKSEYYTVRRSLDGFDEYYNHLKEAEIIQLVGRQRSHLHPEQKFSIYLIGTNLDLSFLEAMGVEVNLSHGLEWTSEAGNHGQALKLSLIKQAIALGEKFWKLTQTKLAQELGVTQGRISQILSELGGGSSKEGKAKLKKILMPLYENYIGELINPMTILNLKQFHAWLNLEDDDLLATGLNTLKMYFQTLSEFLQSGQGFEEFEQKTEMPIFLAGAIALGADPPPEPQQ